MLCHIWDAEEVKNKQELDWKLFVLLFISLLKKVNKLSDYSSFIGISDATSINNFL